MDTHAHRAVDYLPTGLHQRVSALAARRLPHRPLSQLWDWACLRAAADVLDALDGHCCHRLPAPVDHRALPYRVKVAWTVREDEEREQLRLITLGGSSRTAVLICAAEVYVAAEGDLVRMLRARAPGLPWGELPG